MVELTSTLPGLLCAPIGARRALNGAQFARHRGVDYSTVWWWRRRGRLPQARKVGARVLVPPDADVIDGDFARAYPSGTALLLHVYRHADRPATRGWALSRAFHDLPTEQTRAFLRALLPGEDSGETEEAISRLAGLARTETDRPHRNLNERESEAETDG